MIEFSLRSCFISFIDNIVYLVYHVRMKKHDNFGPNFQSTGRLLINAFRAFEKNLLAELLQRYFSDITPSHLNVIRHLNPEGMKLIELAKDATLSKQAISKICNNLEQKGYIQLMNDSTDGRAKMVSFTPKGVSLIDAATNITKNIETQYYDILGEEQYKRLRESLKTLLRESENE